MRKVFVLGLSSTGKHSLMAALEILGYSTVHYPLSFSQVAKYDASCDLFIVKNYKQLDKKYPGAKFIYTERDESEWLQDVLNHLKKFPSQSLTPFKRMMRQAVWGSENPTASQLLTTSQKHRDDCKEYFKNRAKDLLYMDIPQGDGWEKLCPFLGSKIPPVEFPYVHKNLAT